VKKRLPSFPESDGEQRARQRWDFHCMFPERPYIFNTRLSGDDSLLQSVVIGN